LHSKREEWLRLTMVQDMLDICTWIWLHYRSYIADDPCLLPNLRS